MTSYCLISLCGCRSLHNIMVPHGSSVWTPLSVTQPPLSFGSLHLTELWKAAIPIPSPEPNGKPILSSLPCNPVMEEGAGVGTWHRPTIALSDPRQTDTASHTRRRHSGTRPPDFTVLGKASCKAWRDPRGRDANGRKLHPWAEGQPSHSRPPTMHPLERYRMSGDRQPAAGQQIGSLSGCHRQDSLC